MLHSDHASGTIIAPDQKVASTEALAYWTMKGDPHTQQGTLKYFNDMDDCVMTIELQRINGLYYIAERTPQCQQQVKKGKHHDSPSRINKIVAPPYDPVIIDQNPMDELRDECPTPPTALR